MCGGEGSDSCLVPAWSPEGDGAFSGVCGEGGTLRTRCTWLFSCKASCCPCSPAPSRERMVVTTLVPQMVLALDPRTRPLCSADRGSHYGWDMVNMKHSEDNLWNLRVTFPTESKAKPDPRQPSDHLGTPCHLSVKWGKGHLLVRLRREIMEVIPPRPLAQCQPTCSLGFLPMCQLEPPFRRLACRSPRPRPPLGHSLSSPFLSVSCPSGPHQLCLFQVDGTPFS